MYSSFCNRIPQYFPRFPSKSETILILRRHKCSSFCDRISQEFQRFPRISQQYSVIGPTPAPHGCRSTGATWVIDPCHAAAGKRIVGPLCRPVIGPMRSLHGCLPSGATKVIDPFRTAAGKCKFGPLCRPVFGS